MFFRHMHRKLDAILDGQARILAQGKAIMAAIDDVQADISAEDTVIGGAILLLQSIPGLIANAGVDPTKLAALRQDIQSHTTSLAAAILAGTPAPVAGAAPVTPAAATAAATAASTT